MKPVGAAQVCGVFECPRVWAFTGPQGSRWRLRGGSGPVGKAPGFCGQARISIIVSTNQAIFMRISPCVLIYVIMECICVGRSLWKVSSCSLSRGRPKSLGNWFMRKVCSRGLTGTPDGRRGWGAPRQGLGCIAGSFRILAKVMCRTHCTKNRCIHGVAVRRPVAGVSVLSLSRHCPPFWPTIVSFVLNGSLAQSRLPVNTSDIQEHPRVSLPSVSSGVMEPGLAQRWQRALWFMPGTTVV